MPVSASPAMAASNSAPPASVSRPAVSPRKSQTQNGASTTSIIPNSDMSAAGTLREPEVMRINARPSWNTPMARLQIRSWAETSSPCPLSAQTVVAMTTPSTPAMTPSGNMSVRRPRRSETTKVA